MGFVDGTKFAVLPAYRYLLRYKLLENILPVYFGIEIL
jgi:hypothetical protein